MIQNRKYLPNKKNKGKPPEPKDERVKYVPIGCGKCMECRSQKKREWQVRLHEEVSNNRSGKFVTLSFSQEELAILEEEARENKPHLEGYEIENEAVTIAVRRFLENWRSKKGKSVRHWLVTELGQTRTERIHIHGIIFTGDLETLQEKWTYGNIWVGSYVSERTVNYIVKYIHKTDQKHPNYKPKIFVTPGIGATYLKTPNKRRNEYQGEETREYYTTRQGYKIALPKYYRNKIYTEEEKEKLWLNLLDKNVRWVNGVKIDISQGDEEYYKYLAHARQVNKKLGYGDEKTDWNKKQYEYQRRHLEQNKRYEILCKSINDE